MKFSFPISSAAVVALASFANAYSEIVITNNGATYTETNYDVSDLSTPAGASISTKVITGTKNGHTYTKTIFQTVFSDSEATEATAETTAAETTAAETSSAEASSASAQAPSASTYDGAAGKLEAAASLLGVAGIFAFVF